MMPTGVARTNPPFGPLSTMAGVASACRARKPALVSSTIETRKSRSSWLRRATSLTIRPSATFTTATARTSQKCDAWCSQCTSSDGMPSSKASPRSGTASATTMSADEVFGRRAEATMRSIISREGAPAQSGIGPTSEEGQGGRRMESAWWGTAGITTLAD